MWMYFARLSKSNFDDLDNTSDHLERIIGNKRCRSADETRNNADEDAWNDNDNNYNTNVTNFEQMAVQSIIVSSTTIAPTSSTTAAAVASDVDDDDDIIIEKYVGGKLGETVTVGSTRMSVGFYRYAHEQIQIKQEKKERKWTR